MLKQFYDYYFWFSQPLPDFVSGDKLLMLKFAGAAAAGAILLLLNRFVIKDVVIRKLLKRFANLGLTIGLSGLAWVGLRFENTPIFSRRYFAGAILLIGLVWLVFILKYWIFNFRPDRAEAKRQELKNKYLPNRK